MIKSRSRALGKVM